MKCGTARKYLYLDLGAGGGKAAFPHDADLDRAKAHLAQCAVCQRFFELEDRTKALLDSRAPMPPAPATLRERVLREVARERERLARGAPSRAAGRRKLMVALVAALVMVSAVTALWVRSHSAGLAPVQLASVLIEDHAHAPERSAEISSSDHAQVQSWFRGKLDFTFRLPPAPSDDAALIGGRLCNLGGRPAALILYQQPQSRLSLFILDGNDVDLPDERLVAVDGKRCLMDSKKGYNAVLWKERGLIYGLVSDLSNADLLKLAAQF